MLIDGFTTIAQIVNFLILIFLLKRFLYKPIMKVIEERELRIKHQIQEASVQLEKAEQETLLYRSKNKELEQKKQAFLIEAKQEVVTNKELLLEEAQQEIEKMKLQWYKQLEKEKRVHLKDLQLTINQQVRLIVNHILADLANSNLEAEIINMFLKRIQGTDLSYFDQDQDLVVNTSFPLKEQQQKQLTQTVHQYINPNLTINFQTVPNLVCGIELINRNYRLSWNVQQYLQELAGILVS